MVPVYWASIGRQSDDGDHSFKKLNPPQVTPLPFDQVTDIELVCEMDEQWSFIQRKQQQRWLWYAWSPQFKRVFAYALGERTDETCKQLLKRLNHLLSVFTVRMTGVPIVDNYHGTSI